MHSVFPHRWLTLLVKKKLPRITILTASMYLIVDGPISFNMTEHNQIYREHCYLVHAYYAWLRCVSSLLFAGGRAEELIQESPVKDTPSCRWNTEWSHHPLFPCWGTSWRIFLCRVTGWGIPLTLPLSRYSNYGCTACNWYSNYFLAYSMLHHIHTTKLI